MPSKSKIIKLYGNAELPPPGYVKIFREAPQALVSRRETVNTYQVNREIKYWASWFLLKMLTPESGYLFYWLQQKERILAYLQMNENTFRHHMKQLEIMGLLIPMPNIKGFRLVKYAEGARIMGIYYTGTYAVSYDHTIPAIGPKGKPVPARQSFQYILRAEEFEREKERQLNAIMKKLDENPKFYVDVCYLLARYGADARRLSDADYFQQRLLQLQITFFREGSDLLQWTYDHVRADINRGVKKIKEHHGYRAAQSVSYLKKRMWGLGIITVKKECIKSLKRSRLLIPDEENGGEKDGYKWLQKEKCTALFLTDQITPNYETTFESSWGHPVKQTA